MFDVNNCLPSDRKFMACFPNLVDCSTVGFYLQHFVIFIKLFIFLLCHINILLSLIYNDLYFIQSFITFKKSNLHTAEKRKNPHASNVQ